MAQEMTRRGGAGPAGSCNGETIGCELKPAAFDKSKDESHFSP